MAEKKQNTMSEFKVEKVVLNIGGTEEKLQKGAILLEKITGKKTSKSKGNKKNPHMESKTRIRSRNKSNTKRKRRRRNDKKTITSNR